MRRATLGFACAALLAAPPAAALAAPVPGQIVAVSDQRLITVNPDGSGLRSLPIEGDISGPAWSPEGNRIAFALAGRIVVYDLPSGRATALTAGPRDSHPGWSQDGRRVAFLRASLAAVSVPAGGGDVTPLPFVVPPGTTEVGWAPDLARAAFTSPGLLLLSGLDLPLLSSDIRGAPAWSPGGDRLAFAADGLKTVAVAGGAVVSVTAGPAGPPRWSPDGETLVYPAGDELRTVTARGGTARTVSAAARASAVDWQPCTAGVTVSCESVSPPHCSVTALSATTQAGQAVEFGPWPCSDPAGRSLSFVLVKAPDHGTLAGHRYTPEPGFTGQDVASFRVSNGFGESEPVRLTIFVVPRPATAGPAVVTPTVRRAPFLSARATPRLHRHRHRRVRVRLSCDQNCAVALRLTATLRSKRTLKGSVVRRSLPAGRVVALRLRLPSRPRSRLKTVWIRGTVRNAAGLSRRVKLPVTLPR